MSEKIKEITNDDDYTVMELFQEFMDDQSWEPDTGKRVQIAYGILYTIIQ